MPCRCVCLRCVCFHASFVPPFGSRPIIYPENAKRAPVDGSTKPTNRRSNLCEIFSSKKPLLRGTSSYKRGLHPIISPESRKRGVQITSNASQTALTSMLKTVKIGVWEPRKGLMPCGFHRMASKPVCSLVVAHYFCCL